MKKYLLVILLFTWVNPAMAQSQLVGNCEGCEAVFDYGNRVISNTDTLPEFHQTEPKIKLTGTIYKNDGKTPAEGVIVFIHHTNREGVYPKRGNEEGWESSYGYIHGWVKTGADGKYTFYTFKPGSYSENPAHIHPIILEPNGKYYWVGSYLFEGDPHLSRRQLNQQNPRGGSNGIMTLKKEDGILVGERDFILGKNVKGYKK